MLRSLKEVQADDNVVGFYQAMALGSFFNQTLVETQAIHQEKLRHGGVVIVHGVLFTCSKPFEAHTFVTRRFADYTRECLFQGVPTDKGVSGCFQTEQFQYGEVCLQYAGVNSNVSLRLGV